MTLNTIFEKDTVGPPLQASKWLKVPVLLDESEMEALITALSPFWMIQTSGLINEGEEMIDSDAFLSLYQAYTHALKQGEILHNPLIRAYFSSIWTQSLDVAYKVKMRPTQNLVKIELPSIQLQSHKFAYSSLDKKFRSMVLGADCIDWGIQFSFPTLFQNEKHEILTLKELNHFPNAQFFKSLQSWIRTHTVPTSILVEGIVTHVPIRLGIKCLSWINCHPQLKSKKMTIVNSL